MTDFKDPKNIPSLFREMEDHELPKGFDDRFAKKLDREQKSWLQKLSLFSIPNVGWAVGLVSVFAVSLKVVRSRKENAIPDFAIDDEIDMLENLDTLDEWNDQEDES